MTQEKTKTERLRYCVDRSLNCVMLNMTKCRLIYWFFILAISTIYVICNWAEVTTFTFFTKFNGKNIIFLLWVAFIIIPLISSLKILNAEVAFLNKNEQEHIKKLEVENFRKELRNKENALDMEQSNENTSKNEVN